MNVLEVARYMLFLAYRSGDTVTNLKLQKLLYYVQAWYLVRNNGNRLFDDELEAWPYGPVVKSVYDAYKRFGRDPINESSINDDSTSDTFNLTESAKKVIEYVVDEYMSYSAYHLVKSIHREAPWQDARNTGAMISTEAMYDLYKTMFTSNSELSDLADTPIEECSDTLI